MANSTKKQAIYTAGILTYLVLLLVALFVIQNKTQQPIYAFRFNIYALISLGGTLASIVIMYFLVKGQRNKDENQWMLLAVSALICFGIGEMLQRLSGSPAQALFWAQVSAIGTYLAGAGVFLYVVDYTKPIFRGALLTTLVLIGTSMFVYFDSVGSIIFRVEPEYMHLYPWGFNNDVGVGFLFHILWLFGLYFISIALLFRFRRRTVNSILHAQATIFLFALITPVIGGIIFDSLLPLFEVRMFPPLAQLFLTFGGAFMTYGILKYRLFELTPSVVSQNILSTMNEAVIVTNADLMVEFTNQEAGNLLQTDSSALIKKPVTDFLRTDTGIHHAFQTLLTNKGSPIVLPPIEDIVIRRNGKIKHTRILVSSINEGKHVVGYIFVISDVSELKRAYADLEEAKAGVEHTVEVRTRELRAAQKKLIEADKLKTEFIMLTSHNLRTPLSIINGYVSVLKLSKLDDKQKHVVNNLDLSSQRLGKLVNDLLTISAIESKEEQLSRRPMKASELLWEVAHNLDDTAKGNGNDNKFIRKIEAGDAYITASPERLKAALGNILENSFKFTKNGEVKFDANVENNKLVITVQDTGIGIKADELPKLFTKFHRGTDTLEFGYEGGGIGLYLTKLVIDEHEGTIKVESKEGEGTKTTVTLPVAPTPSGESGK